MTEKVEIKSLQHQVIGLVVWFIISFSASAVGAIASFQAKSFYGSLIQPAWAPPAWLFGPVWTLLYAMMAIAAWLVWRRGGFKSNQLAISLFFMQLILNGLWSWMFFAWNLGALSLVNITMLWMMIVMNVMAFWRVDKIAGALLVPYLLWVSFAAVLNHSMWQLNPQVLG
jgi:tryptophan-rich sensory protein